MIDANSQFFAILTNVGLAKQANADALGIPWKITDMGLGDANLAGVADPPNPVPSPTQTKLINEWRRRPLNQLKIDPANPAIIIAEQIIPADEGGRWIREIGLYDEAGDLVAVANCAPSYKPLLSQGSGRTQVVRMNFIVNNAGNITLKIDPAVVLASRAYVDAAILEVLPANKTAGEFTRVKVNNRGVVVSGDNPNTLAGMGITDTYTKTQIEAMIAQASALPVGAQMSFPVNNIPPGFLERDGSVKSISLYPDLAAYLDGAFNRGDEGPGNFRLPESRGEFERGWDHGRGVDIGRAVGSLQIGSFLPGDNNAADENIYVHNAGDKAGLGWDTFTGSPAPGSVRYMSATGSSTPDPVPIALHGGAARPRNVAVVMCIKAWNAPINQGNIDIAALSAQVEQLALNGPVVGTVRNAKMVIGVASAVATFTADEVVVRSALDGFAYCLSSFNKPINLATVGAGGMDNGAAPVSGYVALYAIYNPATKLSALIATNATTSVVPEVYGGANMPAGYSASALVAVVPTDAARLIKQCVVLDRRVFIPFTMAVTTTTPVTSLTAASIAAVVPPNARTFSGWSAIGSTNAINAATSVAGSASGIGYKQVAGSTAGTGNVFTGSFSDIPITVQQTLYWITVGGSGTLNTGQVNISEYQF